MYVIGMWVLFEIVCVVLNARFYKAEIRLYSNVLIGCINKCEAFVYRMIYG